MNLCNIKIKTEFGSQKVESDISSNAGENSTNNLKGSLKLDIVIDLSSYDTPENKSRNVFL